VRLVVGQDGAQMPFAEDQHAVEELTAHAAVNLLSRSRIKNLNLSARSSS
jgi:hypothetical protein